MQLPVDMPSALLDVLELGERLDGASVVYTPDDRVVFTSPAFREHYFFCSFDHTTYDDIFWTCVKHGLYGASEMRMSATEYFFMAKAARRANEQLDFTKRYKHMDMIAHHRAVNGWSVQVRLPTTSPLWRGGFAGVSPKTLAEAAGAAAAASNMRQAIESLSTGMIFLDSTGDVLWANSAGHLGLSALAGVSLHNDRFAFEDRLLGEEFFSALKDVFSGKVTDRKYIKLPLRRGGMLICSIVPHLQDEAVMLLAPQLDNDCLIAALRGFGLSAEESRVTLLTAAGLSTQQVAAETGKSHNTVRAQLGAVQRKFGDGSPHSRTGAVGMTLGMSAVAGVRKQSPSPKGQLGQRSILLKPKGKLIKPIS